MSAVVFIDVVEPGPGADALVAELKRSVPASFAIVAGTERIEVFFGGSEVDEEGARKSLRDAIAAASAADGEPPVRVVPPRD